MFNTLVSLNLGLDLNQITVGEQLGMTIQVCVHVNVFVLRCCSELNQQANICKNILWFTKCLNVDAFNTSRHSFFNSIRHNGVINFYSVFFYLYASNF